MARVENCVLSNVNHIYWRDDSFTEQDKSTGHGLENNLECAIQHQEPRDFPSECTYYIPRRLWGILLFPV